MKALIIDRVSPVIAKGLQALGAEVDIKILPSVDELKEMLPEYDLLVMRVDPKIGRDILDAAAKRVKMIAVCAAGTNHIDLEYARELGILKEKDTNFTGADTRNGMTAVVAIKHPDPIFEGQTKTKMASADATKAVFTVTGDELQLYFDRNVEVLKGVIACAEKSARIRRAEEKAKTNMLTKSKFSFDSNGKLANCAPGGCTAARSSFPYPGSSGAAKSRFGPHLRHFSAPHWQRRPCGHLHGSSA